MLPTLPETARRWVRRSGRVFLLLALVALWWQVFPVRPRVSWNAGQPTRLECFSPDGRSLVTTSGSPQGNTIGPLRVWDTKTGNECWSDEEGASRLATIRFSPDGQFLAAIRDDFNLKLWEVKTGQDWAEFTLDSRGWFFSPDGRFLVYFVINPGPEMGPLLHWWSLSQRKVLATVKGWSGYLAFATDGRRFGLFHRDENRRISRVQCWDVGDGPNPLTLAHEYKVEADQLAFSPDLKTFATATELCEPGDPTELKLWDMATGTVQTSLKLTEGTRVFGRLLFSPDGNFLIGAGRAASYVVWDIHQQWKVVHDSALTPHFSEDGRWFVVRNEKGAKFLDTRSDQRRRELRNPIDLWKGEYLGSFNAGPEAYFPALTIAPDGNKAVMEGPDVMPLKARISRWQPSRRGWPSFDPVPRVDKLWDTESGQVLVTLRKCKETLFSPDSKSLATSYDDGTVRIWDVPPRKPLGTLFAASLGSWLGILFVWRRLRSPQSGPWWNDP